MKMHKSTLGYMREAVLRAHGRGRGQQVPTAQLAGLLRRRGGGARGMMAGGGLPSASAGSASIPHLSEVDIEKPYTLGGCGDWIDRFAALLPGGGRRGWRQRTIKISKWESGYPGDGGFVIALAGSPPKFVATVRAGNGTHRDGSVWMPARDKIVKVKADAPGRPGERYDMLAALIGKLDELTQ